MSNGRTKSKDRLFLIGLVGVIIGLFVNALGPGLVFEFTGKGLLAETLFPSLGYLIIVIFVGYSVYHWVRDYVSLDKAARPDPLQTEIAEARQRAKEEPDKAKPAWDLARAKLEQYFDRNLSQINSIFWLSVIVMFVGFAFIIYGVSLTLKPIPVGGAAQPNITPALVGTVAGIITEFIGATFLFIYRSTIQQALTYTKTLERINSVGMAMQILDTISDESKSLKDGTKAEIVKMVLLQAGGLHQESATGEQQAG